MNNFDGSRINEMDEFLKFLYAMSKNSNVDHDIVYNALCYYNLKDNDKVHFNGKASLNGRSNEGYFEYWEKAFQHMPNTRAFRDPAWAYFFQFVSRPSVRGGEYIKLYVPLDLEYLYAGVNQLFDFLDKNQILHQSKVSKKVRVDNVIIRLRKGDYESARKIIDYINSNLYIHDGLNKPNPFIPTVNGVGIMDEHGNSYNSDISYYIERYIQICRSRNCGVSAANFKYFLEECKKRNMRFDGEDLAFDDSLLETFNEAYTGKKKMELNSSVSDEEKYKLIEEAFRATYNKYGLEQVVTAVGAACSGNYEYITNGRKDQLFRDRMNKHVNGREVSKFVSDNLLGVESNKSNEITMDQIKEFCHVKISGDLTSVLDKICRVTFEKYGIDQVKRAIRHFASEKNPCYFSRYHGNNQEVNYRDKIKYFDNILLFNTMKKTLESKGLDVSRYGASQLIESYVDSLAYGRGMDESYQTM